MVSRLKQKEEIRQSIFHEAIQCGVVMTLFQDDDDTDKSGLQSSQIQTEKRNRSCFSKRITMILLLVMTVIVVIVVLVLVVVIVLGDELNSNPSKDDNTFNIGNVTGDNVSPTNSTTTTPPIITAFEEVKQSQTTGIKNCQCDCESHHLYNGQRGFETFESYKTFQFVYVLLFGIGICWCTGICRMCRSIKSFQ